MSSGELKEGKPINGSVHLIKDVYPQRSHLLIFSCSCGILAFSDIWHPHYYWEIPQMDLDPHNILAQRLLLSSPSIDEINTKAKYTLAEQMGKNSCLSP